MAVYMGVSCVVFKISSTYTEVGDEGIEVGERFGDIRRC